MPTIVLSLGLLLVALGGYTFVSSSTPSAMTLIPAMLGVAVVAVGIAARNEAMQRRATQAALVLAILGIVGGIGPLAMGGASRFPPLMMVGTNGMLVLSALLLAGALRTLLTTPGSVAEPAPAAASPGSATEPAPAAASPGSAAEPAPAASAPGSAAKPGPRPMAFAIMRNTHEGIRGGMKELAAALEAGDMAAFRAEWEHFDPATKVHRAMEDEGMFPLLNGRFDEVCKQEGLMSNHDLETAAHERLREAAAGDDLDALKEAYSAWATFYEEHMVQEEGIMLPLTMKLGSTPTARGLLAHNWLVLPGLSVGDSVFEGYLAYMLRMLEKHGSEGQPPEVAVRVYIWGLQHCSTPTEWERFLAVTRDALSPGLFSKIDAEFKLSDPGKLDPQTAARLHATQSLVAE